MTDTQEAPLFGPGAPDEPLHVRIRRQPGWPMAVFQVVGWGDEDDEDDEPEGS